MRRRILSMDAYICLALSLLISLGTGYIAGRVAEVLNLNQCEITVENHFWDEFKYQEYLDTMKKFLNITKVEVNLLPYDQTFNYNVNCIAMSNRVLEKYNVLQKIYVEQSTL